MDGAAARRVISDKTKWIERRLVISSSALILALTRALTAAAAAAATNKRYPFWSLLQGDRMMGLTRESGKEGGGGEEHAGGHEDGVEVL